MHDRNKIRSVLIDFDIAFTSIVCGTKVLRYEEVEALLKLSRQFVIEVLEVLDNSARSTHLNVQENKGE